MGLVVSFVMLCLWFGLRVGGSPATNPARGVLGVVVSVLSLFVYMFIYVGGRCKGL